MPYTVVSAVFLQIGDVPLSTPAWECLNPLTLRLGPATRGQDRLIPGAAGVRPYPRRAAPRRHQLDLLVVGDRDWTGAAYDDPYGGRDTNLMHLRDNITDPDGATIRTAVLTLPDASTVTGQVQIEDFTWSYVGHDAIALLDLSVPLGALVDGGS